MKFPYELHRVPGAQALAKLDELRAIGVALILGAKDSVEHTVESMASNDGESIEALIAEAMQIQPIKWLQQRKADDPDFYATETQPWPDDVVPNNSLSAHLNILTGKLHPEVFLTVLPATESSSSAKRDRTNPASWMAPCYLRIGGWNEMPKAAEHAALFKLWQERFGATVACIANDVIEFTVERPPTTKAEALQLAEQQFVYCADIVHQGVGSIEALAATLLNASVWYFWWD